MYRTSAWLLCVAMTAVVSATAFGETYYVSPGGQESGHGAPDSPWPTVEYALSQVGGSNTIVLLPGEYSPFRIDETYGGTASNPTVIISQTKWKARVRSQGDYGIVTDSRAPWVVIDGIEVSGASMVGVLLQASNNVVRNCWIHNNSNQGIGAYSLNGTVIDSNLIEFNGQFPHFHHGVYADGDSLTICNNIIRYNSGLGLQLYPALTNSLVYNNLVTDQPAESGILISCPLGGGHNRVLNNTSCHNGGFGIRVWNGNGEVLANNICVDNKSGQIGGDDASVGTTNTVLSGNLTSGDPMFIDPEKGVYWLQNGSPAIRSADVAYRPPTDFWSVLFGSGAFDQGAFQYHVSLTDPAIRSAWPNGYAFRRRQDTPGMEMPDLWIAPLDAKPIGRPAFSSNIDHNRVPRHRPSGPTARSGTVAKLYPRNTKRPMKTASRVRKK